MDYFAERGFSGDMWLGDVLSNTHEYEQALHRVGDPFTLHQVTPFGACEVDKCTKNQGAHSCMPGEPFLFLGQFLSESPGAVAVALPQEQVP
jgi:hypothetical protein